MVSSKHRFFFENFDVDQSVSPCVAAPSHDNRLVFVAGCWDRSVHVISTRTRKVIDAFGGHSDVVSCLALSVQVSSGGKIMERKKMLLPVIMLHFVLLFVRVRCSPLAAETARACCGVLT